jgi:MoxR-like ATPase
VKNDLSRAIASGVPVLIWGPPGVGKTAAILALGRRLGLPVEVVIASIREPTDFAGLPVVHDGEVRFAPPAWARRLAAAGKGILFLDEISTAPPAVQAALLRVVLDRVVGDLPLPPAVTIVAAANPPDMTAGGWDLAPPLANRFIHLQWRVDAGEWAAEFPHYWGDPPPFPAWTRPSGPGPGPWWPASSGVGLISSFSFPGAWRNRAGPGPVPAPGTTPAGW